MQAQKENPPDMLCKDKFLLQSVVASPGATTKDINPEMVIELVECFFELRDLLCLILLLTRYVLISVQ